MNDRNSGERTPLEDLQAMRQRVAQLEHELAELRETRAKPEADWDSRPGDPTPSESELIVLPLIEAMADAIQVVDRQLRILFCNKAGRNWFRQLGLPSDIVGKLIPEAFPFLGGCG